MACERSIQLAEIGAGAKSLAARARNNQRVRVSSPADPSAATNCSSSPSVAEPISLHGARSSSSSIVPSATASTKASCPKSSSCGLLLVKLLDFRSEARRDRVALELAHGGQHAILHGERFGQHVKRANLFVVWQARIQRIERGLNLRAAAIAICGQFARAVRPGAWSRAPPETALIAEQHHLLGLGQRRCELRARAVPGRRCARNSE